MSRRTSRGAPEPQKFDGKKPAPKIYESKKSEGKKPEPKKTESKKPEPKKPEPKKSKPSKPEPKKPESFTAFATAAAAGTLEQKKELGALADLIKKGLSVSPATPSSASSVKASAGAGVGISSISLSDLNAMFDRESVRTKSECMSDASTLLKDVIIEEKEKKILYLESALQALQSKFDTQNAELMAKTAEAAESKAMAEARQQQVDEAKATAKTWHDLADTLRLDQKELLALWK